jgi:phosphatidyl-myo-inositol dimannoside synthase
MRHPSQDRHGIANRMLRSLVHLAACAINGNVVAASAPSLLVVTPDFPPAKGGIQTLMHRVTLHMTRLQPHVVTLDADGPDAIAENGAVRRVGARRAPHQARVAALNLAAWRASRRLRPDLVLSGHVVSGPAALLIGRRLGVPVAQYFYAKEVTGRPRLAAFAAQRADLNVAISGYCESLVLAAGGPPDSIRRIQPGVDLPPDHTPQPRAERPTLVTVSRLADRYKGHDVVLEAMPGIIERVPGAQWVVVGDGPLRAELERRAAALGVAGSVSFVGSVDDAERDAWLERAHVFVMPSRPPEDGTAGEGFGIVYLEAAARGLPVVAGDTGGSVDAVADGETGLLVPAADPVAVGDAVARLLVDAELRERLAAGGRAWARERAWPEVARRLEDALLDALARGRA